MATATPYPTPQSALRYAGFWIRFVAAFIDGILTGAVAFGVIKGTGAITVTCPADTQVVDVNCPGGVTTIAPLFWVVIGASVLYYIVLWGLGGTIGQRLLGLKIVDANTGQNIGIPRGLLRYIGYLIASVPLMLGLLWAGWDVRKQGWHDKIANTFVVRR